MLHYYNFLHIINLGHLSKGGREVDQKQTYGMLFFIYSTPLAETSGDCYCIKKPPDHNKLWKESNAKFYVNMKFYVVSFVSDWSFLGTRSSRCHGQYTITIYIFASFFYRFIFSC
jgi:hypothetical protein